jgi:hypothetical protein
MVERRWFMKNIVKKERLLDKIVTLINQARGNVARAIDYEMVLLYWSIGKILREEIVKNKRAEYGEQVVQSISLWLTQDYGHVSLCRICGIWLNFMRFIQFSTHCVEN